MRLIKFLLLIILVVVGLGAGVVIISRHIPQGKWDGTKLALNQIPPFISSTIQNAHVDQIQRNVQSWSGKVLGVQDTQASPSAEKANFSASLPQKTIEFIRYSYCKEVVKQYETSQEK